MIFPLRRGSLSRRIGIFVHAGDNDQPR